MDKELQKYYEEQFVMFSLRGWRDLMAQMKEMKAATDRISGVKLEDLRYKQGELSIIDWLLNWEYMCRESFKDLKDQNNETAS